jgi:hypothetical protein
LKSDTSQSLIIFALQFQVALSELTSSILENSSTTEIIEDIFFVNIFLEKLNISL